MFSRPDLLLLVAIFLPAFGALVVWMLNLRGRSAVRQSALITTLLTLLVAGYLVFQYPTGEAIYGAYEFDWMGSASLVDIKFSIGLDGLSIWLFGLSALLPVTAVLVSWEAIEDRATGFYALLLLLETGMLGVFAARDIILFYVFFEFTLIPLFFIIGIWGSEDRRYAAMKFFLYTLAGSLLTFLGLLAIVLWVQSNPAAGTDGRLIFSFAGLDQALQAYPLPYEYQIWIFLALFAGFAVKVPFFPFHTWLPLAHVQAPAAGSVLLAGVLLKIGTYGFVRFCFPYLPEATAAATPWLLWLSVIGIIYGALVALAQTDMKRLIAYSSVSHLGYCMLGVFALNYLGMQGGVLQMINHGISTGGLFAIIGMLYERYHTREIKEFGGLASRTPLLAFFLLLFTFSSIGLPGLNGFAGEFVLLLGAFQRAWTGVPDPLKWQYMTIAVLAVFGVVLGAWYMLWLIQRTFFGPLHEPKHHGSGHVEKHAMGEQAHLAGKPAYQGPEHAIPDMSLREVLALLPLVVFVFWIGLYPKFFYERIAPTVNPLAARVEEPFERRVIAEAENAAIVPVAQRDASAPQMEKPLTARPQNDQHEHVAVTAANAEKK